MADGWQNTPAFSVEEAAQRGVDVYEVLVSGWGNGATNPKVYQWPPPLMQGVSATIAGIAIGPRSTVDRCWISYDLQKTRTNADDQVTDRLRRLSVDSPIIFSQASPTRNSVPDLISVDNSPINTQIAKGVLYALAFGGAKPGSGTVPGWANSRFLYPGGEPLNGYLDSTMLPESYVDASGHIQTFGIHAQYPLLHLLLYLKAPSAFVPLKRFPLVLRGVRDADFTTEEYVVAQIPTYGRRSIRVTITLDGTGQQSFRIGGLRAAADLVDDLSTPIKIFEEGVDSTATPVNAGVPVTLSTCAGQDAYLDYVNIYATGVAGASSGVINWALTATD